MTDSERAPLASWIPIAIVLGLVAMLVVGWIIVS